MSKPREVTWRGVTARYTPSERALMRKLPESERLFLHVAKSLFNGRLR